MIEPLSAYQTRQHRTAESKRVSLGKSEPLPTNRPATIATLHAPLAFEDGWDERILAYVFSRSEPVMIVSLASQLRKCVRHRDKQHKEKLKRDILLRVGALIRMRTLVRVRRKYVVAKQS